MMKRCLYLFGCLLLIVRTSCAQFNPEAARALIGRVVPKYVQYFKIEALKAEKTDRFELESLQNKIVLRGNNGVSVAAALYFYLTNYCHCQITWNGSNLNLPRTLPVVPHKVSKTTPYNYRYYLNYCTFNYSMSWWDWPRWEKEIDWMALHGINMPLAITGEAYTWYLVYKGMGFTDNELSGFFSGPAYFSWFWMGNLDGWGGPLPVNWMKEHFALQKRILQRERALGMQPVMPAFTGHVPAAFRAHFPGDRLKTTIWHNGFADTYILDAQDSLFRIIGKKFLDKQTALLGTDHLYSADTFNENEPPSDEPAFLAKLGASVYDGMKASDPSAIWVMQGWLFYSDRKFWKEPQIRSLLNAVPDDRMILLDLAAEIEPVWKRTQAFYGKPWIWNMLHNFGGNISLFGRMDDVASGPSLALKDPTSGKLCGIGLTMEGIEQNPVLYELMTDHTWSDQAIDPDEWLPSYIRNRYGRADDALVQAWQQLRKTVYNGKKIRDGAESIITGRPTFDSATTWTRTTLNYAPQDLLPVWNAFAKNTHAHTTAGFRYDLVDITRQVLANYATVVQQKMAVAYRSGNESDFKECSRAFLDLITDLDRLLATQQDFLLGPWLSGARSWGSDPAERNLYERNARDLITLWGDANSPLHEYSCRQWSGLLNSFYRARWKQFINTVQLCLKRRTPFDQEKFDKQIRNWEWGWVNSHQTFPVRPIGDAVKTASQLHDKYAAQISNSYKG